MNKSVSNSITGRAACEKCSELFRGLLKKVSGLEKDNQNLTYMLQFRTSALKNREEIIQKLILENRSLFEANKSLKKRQKTPELPTNSLNLSQMPSRSKNPSQHELPRPSHYIPPIQSLRSPSKTDLKVRSVSTSYRRNNESHHIRKITQFSGVETVTENQGFPDFHTLINNREGRRSILNAEEMKQLDHTGLKKLEGWIFANEGLKIGLDLKEQIDLQENLKSFFCDFKRVIKNCANLKKAIKSLFSISSSLDLELNIQRISTETCDSLACEKVSLYFSQALNARKPNIKASFFFLEELTDDPKTTPPVSQIPVSKGVATYVRNTGKILRIDNPSIDPRVGKDLDARSGFKTKNILCAPVKDAEGHILGLLQAVNKQAGGFNQDDTNIIDILSMITGLSVKNSLMYDSVLLNQKKLFRLMEVISRLSNENDLKSFLLRSKEYLSQLVGSKQTQVFLYNSESRSLVVHREIDDPVRVSEPIGIIGFVIEHRKIYESNDPRVDPNYNPVVDLNTDLPIITVPILDEDKTVLGIFQFSNVKSHTERNLGKAKWANYDLISLYSTFLANIFRNVHIKNEREISELTVK